MMTHTHTTPNNCQPNLTPRPYTPARPTPLSLITLKCVSSQQLTACQARAGASSASSAGGEESTHLDGDRLAVVLVLRAHALEHLAKGALAQQVAHDVPVWVWGEGGRESEAGGKGRAWVRWESQQGKGGGRRSGMRLGCRCIGARHGEGGDPSTECPVCGRRRESRRLQRGWLWAARCGLPAAQRRHKLVPHRYDEVVVGVVPAAIGGGVGGLGEQAARRQLGRVAEGCEGRAGAWVRCGARLGKASAAGYQCGGRSSCAGATAGYGQRQTSVLAAGSEGRQPGRPPGLHCWYVVTRETVSLGTVCGMHGEFRVVSRLM